jgi:hypothetical protein
MPYWTAKIESGAMTRIGDRDVPILSIAGELMRPALALEYAWRLKHAADRAEKERIWSLLDGDLKARIRELERTRAQL